MRRFKALLCSLCGSLLISGSASAQTAVRVEPPKGGLGWLTRPYQQRYVPPINLTNSDRLQSLIHAGNLYLSAQDVIALALENNLDIEIQRYGPLLAQEVTLRARGGGGLRNVNAGVAQGPQSVSLAGVSATASGGNTTAAAAVGSGGGIVTALGPAVPNLDPQLVFYTNFAHNTTPFSNTVLTGTSALIQSNRVFQAQFSRYTDFGTYYQFTYYSSWNRYNSFLYNINPYTFGYLDLQVSQNLLNGFGRPVLTRFIRIAKNNQKFANLQFKQQIITTISAVLNLYWDLVSFYQDLKARRDELATAQALYEDNKKQVQIGTLAPIEVTRAEAQVYSSQQDLLISQTNLSQQETVLKNALSRNGVASPILADVHVIPLDTFHIPEKEEFKPIDDLVREALERRVEIAQDRINTDSDKITLAGIKNELKPTLQVFAELTNNGLSGSPNALTPGILQEEPGLAYLVGGYGNLLSQIFRRNFPNYSAGVSLSIPLRNRTAQGDYATQALTVRQDELTLQKAINQVRVDVQNAVIGLRQARVRYDSAVKARILQQQTLDADKKRYTLGAATVFQVVQDQQALASAESAETQALANYSHFQVAFDQAMGTTLDVNHISLEEARSGHVERKSVLPANLPKEP
jgi:outer membrane protein